MPRDSRYTSLSGAPPSPELDQQQPTGLQPPDQTTGLPDYAGNMGEGLTSLAGVEPPLQKLSKFAAFQKVQSDMAKNPFEGVTMTVKPGGQVDLKNVPKDVIENYQRERAQLNEIRGSFAQEAARLKAQEEAAQRMPWYVRLAQGLSANIAQQPNMPGWVQAAGRTSAQLNPMPEQIRAQRLALLKEQAGIAGQAGRADMEMLAMQREQRQAQQGIQREIGRVEYQASQDARRGEFDPETYVNQRVQMGDDPKIAAASAERLRKVSEESTLQRAIAESNKAAAEQHKETLKIDKENRDKAEWWTRFGAQQAAAQDRMEKANAMREEAKIAKDKAAAGKLSAKEEDSVQNLLSAREAGLKLMAIMDPNTTNPDYKRVQKIMGPASGRWTEFKQKIGALDAKDAQAVAAVARQFANSVQTLGAGSYGYRISERGFIQSFSEAMHNLPSQNLGNLRAWMSFYDEKLDAIKTLKPDWPGWERVDKKWGGQVTPTKMGERPDEALVRPEKGGRVKVSLDEINKVAGGQ